MSSRHLDKRPSTLTRVHVQFPFPESKLGVDIPEPDYHNGDDDDDDDDVTNGESPLGSPSDKSPFMPAEGSDGELILPKKLANPNLESREKQDLHRELMMNYKL